MSGSNTTNVPSVTFSGTGFVAPTEASIQTGVLSDLAAAFGANFNSSPATPQGQIATSTAAIIGDQNAVFLYLASQTDPSYATGRMQDAIGRIYFMTRIPATATTVTCTVTGNVGTTLPVGTLAQDASGYTYSLVNAVTFTDTTETAIFQNTTTGAIPCPAGSLTVIYQSITGWISITNPADGVLGSDVESRYAFEQRRQQSVTSNARGMLASIEGAVLAVSGVTDAYAVSNNSNTAATIGGVSVPANSIYVSAVGGASQAVAEAIYSKAPPGIPTAGSTTVTVQDTQSGYSSPYPSYPVSYTPATSTPIYMVVTIANSANVPSNAATLIQNAIISAFAGTDGGNRARIGSTLYASRYYAGIAALGSWSQIVEITIGTAASPTGFTVSLNIDQAPSISAPDISVVLQ